MPEKAVYCYYGEQYMKKKYISLVPRLVGGGGEKEPGTHRSRMRLITPTFRESGYLPFTFVIR